MRSRSSMLRYWCFTTHDRIWRNGSFRSCGEKRNSSFLTSERFQASAPRRPERKRPQVSDQRGIGPTNGSFRGAQWAMTHRPTLGIALGSGSARGWAHIGVLRALTEAGIAPDFVAGCSMGAMVGAAFAAGRIEELEAWALSLDWRRVVGLVDVGLRGGVIKGDRLLNIYQGQFVECPFSELSVPFAAVATDIATGQEVWLRDGKVSDAVRASCAVPGLFRPVLRDGRCLIDGSAGNPIPVSLCRAMGAQVVMAVDLGTHRARRFPLEPPPASTVKSQRRGFFNILGPSPPPEVRPLPPIMHTLV